MTKLTPQNPLSAGDLQSINTALRNMSSYLDALQTAKSAGIDTSEHEQHHAFIVQQLTGLKQAYFPNQ